MGNLWRLGSILLGQIQKAGPPRGTSAVVCILRWTRRGDARLRGCHACSGVRRLPWGGIQAGERRRTPPEQSARDHDHHFDRARRPALLPSKVPI